MLENWRSSSIPARSHRFRCRYQTQLWWLMQKTKFPKSTALTWLPLTSKLWEYFHRTVSDSIVTLNGCFNSKYPPAEGERSDKLYMEGTIVEKLECRPYADQTYMNMKAKSIRFAAQPKRKVEQLDSVVTTFKPISDHKHNVRILLH